MVGTRSWNSLVLQGSYFSLEPEQDPPLLSCTVLYLVYFWVPPPQVAEHDPLANQLNHDQLDQLDHWQSTETNIKAQDKHKVQV